MRFNRNKVGVTDLVAYIMPKVQVVDISIHETDIDEIVRKIYNDGVVI